MEKGKTPKKQNKAPLIAKKPEFPMRINKFLAVKNYSTRKGGDELVSKKKVLINGKIAVLGDKVNETDKVEVRFRSIDPRKKFTYAAYNKKVGDLTLSSLKGQRDIKQNIRGEETLKDVFPVGRLDKDSKGLIILTNDGRITDRLLNPEYSHEKEYIVETKMKLRNNFKEKMEAGVNIEGYVTKECKVTVLDEFTFRIILNEGKKHQIRRMCSAVFNEVTSLTRVRIMNITLGNIPPGGYRILEGEELHTFLKNLGF